jgi:hypothetical protein
LEFNGGGQGFGGFALDAQAVRDSGSGRRPSIAMAVFVMGVIKAVGGGTWEGLAGRSCRIRRKGGLIVAIGNFLKEEWFTPEEEFKRFEACQ